MGIYCTLKLGIYPILSRNVSTALRDWRGEEHAHCKAATLRRLATYVNELMVISLLQVIQN